MMSLDVRCEQPHGRQHHNSHAHDYRSTNKFERVLVYLIDDPIGGFANTNVTRADIGQQHNVCFYQTNYGVLVEMYGW